MHRIRKHRAFGWLPCQAPRQPESSILVMFVPLFVNSHVSCAIPTSPCTSLQTPAARYLHDHVSQHSTCHGQPQVALSAPCDLPDSGPCSKTVIPRYEEDAVWGRHLSCTPPSSLLARSRFMMRECQPSSAERENAGEDHRTSFSAPRKGLLGCASRSLRRDCQPAMARPLAVF